MRGLSCFLAVCAVTIMVWFVAGVNGTLDYGAQCRLIGDCFDDTCPWSSQRYEEFCAWGVLQTLRWEQICGNLFLCVMSISCFALIADRWLTYRLAGRQSKRFMSRIAVALHENRVEQLPTIALMYPASPVAVVVGAGLSAPPFGSRGERARGPCMHALNQAIVFETEDLKRGLWALGALGWAVPLVGVFLFITGVIAALNGMKAAEGTGIGSIAGGLAQSLWPAVFSTMIAIPAIWGHMYFTSRLSTLLLEMDRLSLAIIDQILNQQSAPCSSPPGVHYITKELISPVTSGLAV